MPLPQISYGSKLTYKEANDLFKQAVEELNDIKRNYEGGFLNWRKLKFIMSERNKKRVADLVGTLLPLQLQPSVQEEATKPYEETLSYKSAYLMQTALDMLASFTNTGTTRIGYSEPLWRKKLPFSV